MNLMYPEALLLLIPAVMVWYRYLRTGGVTGGLRLVVILLLVCALSVPMVKTGGDGVDLWVLVDRSESIPDAGQSDMEETISRLEDQRPTGSNLGIIEFAGNVRVSKHPGQSSSPKAGIELKTHATDLYGALQQVFSLRDSNRPTRVLALTDGKYTTRDPLPLGMWARTRSIPVDYRFEGKADVADTSVVDLDVPGEVNPGEPFRLTAWIQAPVSGDVTYRLTRGDTLLDEGTRSVQPGRNRWLFRDVLKDAGVVPYTLTISPSQSDRIPENNRDVGAVRVRTEKKVLVIQPSVRKNRFVSALKDAGLPVVQRSVADAFHSQADLDPFRSVILENVSGSKLGRDRMRVLKNWVRNFGGSLLMTGGTRSFARGGYIASPLEPVLPVSMKLKEEKRRSTASVAIVLDRSGSMSASVGGGDMKMDLANLAAVESLEVLQPSDELSVIAVDRKAHVMVELQKIRGNHAGIKKSIFGIRPGGGGIFVRTGLEAAMMQLADSQGATKHMILFADARDSEERTNVRKKVQEWNSAGVTVSVVGLGTSGDQHASFLKDVAAEGKGQVHFTNKAKDLPRIFVQDVTRSIRRTFIKKQTPLVTTPHVSMLTGQEIPDPPPVGGFNVTRKKKNASVPIQVVDNKTRRPGIALWNHGLGRAAAMTFEADGKYTGPFLSWDRYPEVNSLLVRWMMAQEQNENVSATFERDGSIGTIRVTLNPDRERTFTGSEPVAFISTPGAGGKEVPLEWHGPDELRGTIQLNEDGIYIGAVDLGTQQAIELPPVGLGYPPEFRTAGVEGGTAEPGSELLSRLGDVSGGTERINLSRAFDTDRTGQVRWSLLVPLFLAALILFVTEIAVRRLRLLEYVYSSTASRVVRDAYATAKNALASTLIWSGRNRTDDDRPGGETGGTGEPTPSGGEPDTPWSGDEDEPSDAEEPDESAEEVFGRAKDRARRRMDDEK